MKTRVLLFFLLSSFVDIKSISAQYTLSGKIVSCKTNEPLKEVTVLLIGSNGTNVKTKTDSLGNYIFESSILKTNAQYLLSTISTGVRSNIDKDAAFLNSTEKYKFSTDSLSQFDFKYDFCLVEYYPSHRSFPGFFFDTQTTKLNNNFLQDTTYNYQNEFTFVTDVLNDYPSIVLEVVGHANFDEINVLELSTKRAQTVKDSLVKRGIDEKRLSVKGYGFSKPAKIDENIINKTYVKTLKTKEEQENAYQRNRRVVIRVLSWDYEVRQPTPQPKILGYEE